MEKVISLRLSKKLLERVREEIKGKETLSEHIRRLLSAKHSKRAQRPMAG